MDNHVWHVNGHERCMFCGVNIHDNDIYGPYVCTERKLLVWTSETGKVSSEVNAI